MSSINRTAPRVMAKTYEGASVAVLKDAEKQLRRVALASMMWEDEFYIDGVAKTAMLAKAVLACDPKSAQAIAEDARGKYKLRHLPLQIMRELARVGKLEASALTSVIQRPDEIGEFISLYWKDNKQPLSNQVKKGLAAAFNKFNEYQFGKWNKNSAAVKLRDAMFLVHAKPSTPEQEVLFKKIADDTLDTPDTWETELSAGADKKETFTRLMQERKLGAMAFIRNLRNMAAAGVDTGLIEAYAAEVSTDRVLPFRYVAAARMVPQFKAMLERMMLRSLASHEKLAGHTVLLVDVSGSMFGPKVSEKSDLDRFDAAAALAILAREICESVTIYTFSNSLVKIINPSRGFTLIDALSRSQSHSGTAIGSAVRNLHTQIAYDRCIIFTDEQSRDTVPAPKGKGYVVNVASYQHGIGSNAWTTVTGFSEAVIDFIQESEKTSW